MADEFGAMADFFVDFADEDEADFGSWNLDDGQGIAIVEPKMAGQPKWNAMGLSGSDVVARLTSKPEGTFELNKSTNGHFAQLSMIGPDGSVFRNDIVETVTPDGVIQGIALTNDKHVFDGVDQLVEHFATFASNLPCLLKARKKAPPYWYVTWLRKLRDKEMGKPTMAKVLLSFHSLVVTC
jgi:hypothetical protein